MGQFPPQAQDQTEEVDYDTSDPEQVNTAKKKDGRNNAKRLLFVENSMATFEGRAWFYGHVFEDVFVPGMSDLTGYRCGERNIGLRILADIQSVAPKDYLTMVEENKNGR
jgi:hypothetical protein